MLLSNRSRSPRRDLKISLATKLRRNRAWYDAEIDTGECDDEEAS